jgi:two-component system, NarL family, sensor histidine kinase DevS
VRDDGDGFEPDRVAGGFGLLGMRERVALVRGELDVISRPSAGTLLTARIPVQRRDGPPVPDDARQAMS